MDAEGINQNPPSHEDVVKAIKVMAYIGGKTKTEIEEMIKKEWLKGHDERIKSAMLELWSVFDGRESMPRKVVRAGRAENKMKFSDIVKRKLK